MAWYLVNHRGAFTYTVLGSENFSDEVMFLSSKGSM